METQLYVGAQSETTAAWSIKVKVAHSESNFHKWHTWKLSFILGHTPKVTFIGAHVETQFYLLAQSETTSAAAADLYLGTLGK